MTIITPLGSEALVNTTTFQNQSQQRGTALANGQYVVVWVDYLLTGQLNATNTANADIKARIFNADGSAAGAEFTVNTVTAAGQIFPDATTLSDGNFIVTWNNGAGTVIGGAGSPIATASGQEYTAAGTAVGGQFSIGSADIETLLVESAPLSDGGFIATWQQGGAGENIIAQRYDTNNTAIGSVINVSSSGNATISGSIIRTLADGNFVVAWTNAPNQFNLVSAQVFTPAGVPVGDRVGQGFTAGGGNLGNLGSLVALEGGGFALATIQIVDAVSTRLVVNVYDSDGTFVGDGEVSTQPRGTNGRNPQGIALTALPGGGASALWIDNSGTDGSGTTIRLSNYGPSGAQILAANGSQIDSTLTVNTNAAGNQTSPSILTLSNGDLVTLWTDVSGTLGDASGTSIKQQLFNVDPTNRAPVAVNDTFIATDVGEGFGTDYLTDNDSDADGDILVVTSIFNVAGGTVNFNLAAQGFTVSRPAGSSAPIEFDYTISDVSGATSTAHATLLASRTDNVTVRGVTGIIDFLANDGLVPRAQGYGYSLQVLTGNAGPTPPTILQTANGPFIQFQPLNVPGYFDLAVGQTIFVAFQYNVFNPVTLAFDYSETVNITLEGWKQTGGAGYDYLVGGALADHLDGGSGVANQLQGGAGDDFYTIRNTGDSIVEFANGGFDQVRVQGLSSYTLPNNVEALSVLSPTTRIVAIGNDLNNSLAGSGAFADVLVGGGGNDQLRGLGGPANELIGGTGNDTYFVAVAGDSIVEFANEGTDTVSTALISYALRDHLENLTYTGTAAFTGVGNSANNVITGGTQPPGVTSGGVTISGPPAAANTLIGLGGDDTYVINTVGHSTVEAVGGGIDTVRTTLSSYTLQANVENLIYTGSTFINAKGNALDNALTGGANNDDYLFAGAGVDTLTGGAGRDVFFFDSAVNGVDIISDFVSGIDRIFLEDAIFARTATVNVINGTGPFTAADANSVFFYNSTTGALSYDADGNGAGATIQIATLSTGLTLAAGDFVFY